MTCPPQQGNPSLSRHETRLSNRYRHLHGSFVCPVSVDPLRRLGRQAVRVYDLPDIGDVQPYPSLLVCDSLQTFRVILEPVTLIEIPPTIPWDPPRLPASEKIPETVRASLVVSPQPVAYPVRVLHKVVRGLFHRQVAHAYHANREHPVPGLTILHSLHTLSSSSCLVRFMPCPQEICSIYFLFEWITCS